MASVIVSFFCLCLIFSENETIQFQPIGTTGRVKVTAPLPENLLGKIAVGTLEQETGEKLLQLAIKDSERIGPPIFGSYERRGKHLHFHSSFPLSAGRVYQATLLPGTKNAVRQIYETKKVEGTPGKVLAVFPSGNVLPANHLRFYIRFSEPMRGGVEIFKHIQILDEKGEPVYDPWLQDEIWMEDERTMILYIHPGRIKWGVFLRELFGPVLEPNKSYTLVIRREVLDAKGRKLNEEYRKPFRTGPERHERVELSRCKITAPVVGTKKELSLQFSHAIDQSSLKRFIQIVDADDNPVSGKVSMASNEAVWQFTPAQPWRKGEHRIVIDGRLEDTMGNTPLRPFDRDLEMELPPPQSLELSFFPRAAKAEK